MKKLAEISMEEAIALIDPALSDRLSPNTVADLFAVAAGNEVTTERTLTSYQLSVIARHRVLPLVPHHWSTNTDVAKQRLQIGALEMQLERSWRELREALGNDADQVRLLKGMATANLDYSSPQLRHIGDIDILVPVDLFAELVDRLVSAGYSKLATDDPRRYGVDKGLALRDPHGIEIDIHTRLSQKYSTGDALIFEDPEPVPALDGLALPKELRLIHAALHFIASTSELRRMSGCADVITILSDNEADSNRVDLDRTLELATRLDVAGLTGAALRTITVAAARTDLAEAIRTWPEPNWLEAHAYVRPDRFALLEKADILRDAPGFEARRRYVSAVLFPTQALLDQQGGWLAHAKRAFRS